MAELRAGGILCLDLAKITGWAYGHKGDAAPAWGVWEPPEEFSYGRLGLSFENKLDEKLETLRPERLVYEAPLPAHLQGNADTGFILIGLAFATEAAGARWGVQTISRASDTFRNAVIGRSRLNDAEKRVRPKLSVKTAIIAPWIDERGWGSIADHNARDAAVIWAYETGERHAMFGRRRAA